MTLTSTQIAVIFGMTFWKQSARLSARAGVAFLLVLPAGGLCAGIAPQAIEDTTLGVPASVPSTVLPRPPLSLPELGAFSFVASRGMLTGIRPIIDRESLAFSPVFGADRLAAFRPGGFAVRLLSRMSLEARRYRDSNVSQAGSGFGSGFSEEFDSIAEASRSSVASRVIMRSSHHAVNEELERVARASLGLGSTLDGLQNFSLRRARAGSSGTGSPVAAREGAPTSVAGSAGLRADFGLRLDAHPALLLRAQYGKVRGRIEVPVLNDPIRLSLETPFGARGRAVLASGMPRDGQGWATLTFNFGF
jgi:hypothetical protein